MPRNLEVGIIPLSGVVAKCMIRVNHNLVVDALSIDAAAGPSWNGGISSARTPITIEAFGVGMARFRVVIVVDGEIVTDVDRQLQSGSDVFQRSV
jgi:hypothetical protein